MGILYKYGGDPQFAPQFVLNVYDVLALTDGKSSLSIVEESLAPESSTLFHKHIQFSVTLGLFESHGQNLQIPDASTVGLGRLTPKLFSRYLRDVLIVKKIPKELNSLQALLLWAYSVRPLHDVAGKRTGVVPKSFGKFEPFGIASGLIGDGLVFKGDTQYTPTRRWLEALGVVVDIGKETYAFSYELANEEIYGIFPEGRMLIREFTNKVRYSLPYLPGGQWNKLWTEVVNQNHVVDSGISASQVENELTEIESVILSVMRSQGRVELFDSNDAVDRMRMSISGTDTEMLTHIDFKAKETPQ
jgi:hypothetical protein